MNAIIYEKYGPPNVLHFKEVEKPIPKEHEVLIKICATTVTKYDCWVRSCTAPPGFGLFARIDSVFTKPKKPILGTEFAGDVDAVGNDVTRLKKVDQVFGFSGMTLGTSAA